MDYRKFGETYHVWMDKGDGFSGNMIQKQELLLRFRVRNGLSWKAALYYFLEFGMMVLKLSRKRRGQCFRRYSWKIFVSMKICNGHHCKI